MKFFMSCCKHKLLLFFRALFQIDVPYLKFHYGQEGEDCLLEEFFRGRKEGFYVDIGAHHPFGYSNTWSFYKRGWQGINIDATPGSMKLFKKFRKRDINLEIPIAGERRKSLFYLFREPALNGFLSEEAAQRIRKDGWELLGTKEMETMPLGEVLKTHVAPGTAISFMSLDVEGVELEILRSNDWEQFRPELLVVEMEAENLEAVSTHPVTLFLAGLNYRPIVKNFRNVFFKSEL